MITITIENYGKYQIPNERLPELLEWIHKVQGVAIKNESTEFQGRQLING
jgi:hypothetical protein